MPVEAMSDERVLEEAQLAREGRLETRHAPFAEHQLRIPTSHWGALVRLFPGLNARDHAEAQAAYERLLASPIADPYRVRSRKAQLGHL
jgi:hypothetical protein